LYDSDRDFVVWRERRAELEWKRIWNYRRTVIRGNRYDPKESLKIHQRHQLLGNRDSASVARYSAESKDDGEARLATRSRRGSRKVIAGIRKRAFWNFSDGALPSRRRSVVCGSARCG